MSNSEDQTPIGTAASDVTLAQTPPHCFSAGDCNGCSCSFLSPSETILQVTTNDPSIVPQREDGGCDSSGLNSLLQAVIYSKMN